MESVSRKGGHKRAGKGASGSNSRHVNRKRVLEEGQQKKSAKAKRKTGRKVGVGLDLGKEGKEVGEEAKVGVGLDLGKEGKEVGEEALASEGVAILRSMFGDEIKDICGLSDNEDAWAAWMDELEEPLTASEAEEEEAEAEAEKTEISMEEWEKSCLERMGLPFGEPLLDYNAYQVRCFRSNWDRVFAPYCGAFEATTRIPAMRFTSKPPVTGACLTSTLQVFSLRVEPTRLQFPLHVFGLVAVRDSIDNNRNLVFQRSRDNCQTLTKENPYLVLTGPTRAVYLESTTPVIMEVDLRVKGTDHSEDEQLSSLAQHLIPHNTSYPYLWNHDCTSKLSTVHMTLGCISWSLEATIFLQVTSGSWPLGFQGQFSAFAIRSRGELSHPLTDARVDDEEIVLLYSGSDSVPLSTDGSIQLSRRVVSVQDGGELKVCVKAWRGDNTMKKSTVFKPLFAGRSNNSIDIDGLCAMNVTVAWSLISSY